MRAGAGWGSARTAPIRRRCRTFASTIGIRTSRTSSSCGPCSRAPPSRRRSRTTPWNRSSTGSTPASTGGFPHPRTGRTRQGAAGVSSDAPSGTRPPCCAASSRPCAASTPSWRRRWRSGRRARRSAPTDRTPCNAPRDSPRSTRASSPRDPPTIARGSSASGSSMPSPRSSSSPCSA